MPNTNTRWYRFILLDGAAVRADLNTHLGSIANVVSHSFICCTGLANTSPWAEFPQLIATIIMNGSKSSDDQAMSDLANHLITDHGYTNVSVTVVNSDVVFP